MVLSDHIPDDSSFTVSLFRLNLIKNAGAVSLLFSSISLI